MAATMATMAILNSKCLSTNTPKLANTTKPMITSSKPATLLSIQNLPKGLASSSAVAGAIFAALSASEPAMAAQQLAAIAAESGSDDSRGLALLLPIVPAVLWVLYNILQPALNQLNRMRESKGVVAGLGGLGALATLANAHEASAAEAAAAAGGDSRGQLLLFVITPAVLWVLYNILQPALNQINRMRSD